MKMKTKIVAVLIIVLICFMILFPIGLISEASASTEINDTYNNEHLEVEYTNDGRQIRSMRFMLVYDPYTKIVYCRAGSHYFPYISDTGSYCRYIDGDIIPIR